MTLFELICVFHNYFDAQGFFGAQGLLVCFLALWDFFLGAQGFEALAAQGFAIFAAQGLDALGAQGLALVSAAKAGLMPSIAATTPAASKPNNLFVFICISL